MYTKNFKTLLEDSDMENTALYFKILKMFQEADDKITDLENSLLVVFSTVKQQINKDRKFL